jgi:predicted nucleotidyltransferase
MLKEAISGLLNPSRQSSLPQYPRLRKRCSSDCGWPCLTCDGGMGWCGLSLYGSFARGAAVEDSDVDLLVELPRPLGLEFVALVQRKLGRKVDLATFETFRQSLTSPHYRDIALNIQESWPMSGKRGDREYLAEAVQRIVAYTGELTYEEFVADQKTQDAVPRNLQVMGEAVFCFN